MRSRQRVIVNNHRHAVATELHVKLDPVRPRGDPRFKRRQRILERNQRRTTMSNDKWLAHDFALLLRKLLYGSRAGDDTFELDVEGAVIRFDAAADRNVSRVLSDPNGELALLVINQSLWSKKLGVHAQRIDAAEHCIQSLLLDHLDRNGVDAPAVTNIDVEALADFERLRTNEIDRGEDVLQLSAGELGGCAARFTLWIVWIAQGPGHRAFRAIESRFGRAHALALFVDDRGFLNGESEWFNDRLDHFAKLYVEQAR